MDLFIQNNDNLRPRDEIRIERLAAEPVTDGRRIKVQVDVTPFKERPNLEIAIIEAGSGQIVTNTSVIATMNFNMEFNLHLRGKDDPTGSYTVRAQLYYGEDMQAVQDTREVSFSVPAASTQPDEH